MKFIQKHRIYPNQFHKEFFAKQFGCCRFIWNHFVALARDTGVYLSYAEMSKIVTHELKFEHHFLTEAVAQVLQQTLMDLEKAQQSFFKKVSGPPQFKKKHWRQSCRFPQLVDVENNKLYTSKLRNAPIRIILERELPEFTMCTIVKESDDRWYACFWIERKHIDHIFNPELRHLGIDVGLKEFIITSEGEKISPPKFFQRSENNLARKNRALSKKTKGSRRWLKCKKRLSGAHSKVRRQRADWIHKLTHQIANDNNVQGVSVENLNIKGMIKNKLLAKTIADSSWYLFISTLKYKLEMRGKVLTSCGMFFPSTQLCSHCGSQTGPKSLNIRDWTCIMCDQNHDRDLNAACNIAKKGDAIYHYDKQVA